MQNKERRSLGCLAPKELSFSVGFVYADDLKLGLCKTRQGRYALAVLGMLFLGVAVVQSFQVNLRQVEQPRSQLGRVFVQASDVTGYEHHVNETITVSEWIHVKNGAELVIENSTVIFTNDGVGFIAEKGGSLTIKNCYLHPSAGCSWWIEAETDSHFHVSSSQLVGSYTKENGGLKIFTDDASVTDCTITRFGGDNIHIQGSKDTLISRNTISHSSKEAINIVGTLDTHIVNNSIFDTGFGGIYAIGADSLIIEGNTFENTTYDGVVFVNSHGCQVDTNLFKHTILNGLSMEYCDNMTVSRNTILDSVSAGIGSSHSTRLVVDGNLISKAQWDGIYFEASCSNLRAQNNLVTNCGGGITLRASDNALIAGNNVNNITYNGVCIEMECSDASVIGNCIMDNDIGMYVANHQSLTVVGNLFNGSWENDIKLESSSDIYVYLNAFCSHIKSPADAVESQVKWDNDTVGNYWYYYRGSDVNGDGIGDYRYTIDMGNYDFYPLMSIDPVVEFLENYIIPVPPWQKQESSTTDSPTNTTTNQTQTRDDGQIEIYLLANSIIQLAGISLVVIVILYRNRLR